MTFTVNKVQAGIICPGDLVDAINNNVTITTPCTDVTINDGDQIVFDFVGAGPLSPTEDAELDSILSTFTCPTAPVVQLGDTLGLENNDITLAGTPHHTLNFGTGVAVADDGDGKATVTVTAGGLVSELPVVQGRRIVGISGIPLVWTDVDFAITDVENDNSILEHDLVLRDRFIAKEDGLYMGYYHFNVDDESLARVRIDDTTVVSGSEKEGGDPSDINDIVATVTSTFFVSLTAGQFLTLQVQARTTAENMLSGATFVVMKAQGVKGDTGSPGAPGAGSTLVINDEGINVPNTPHSVLDFVGAGVTVTDAGAGTSTVTIPGSTPSIFGTEFQESSSDANSSTTSGAFQNKLTLVTGSLPSGLYRIGYYIETNNNDTSGRTECRVELNNTTTLVEPSNEAEDSNDWVPFSGFEYQTLSGINTLDLDYRQLVSGTSTVRRARLEIWRIN